jgi:hypothetical protein
MRSSLGYIYYRKRIELLKVFHKMITPIEIPDEIFVCVPDKTYDKYYLQFRLRVLRKYIDDHSKFSFVYVIRERSSGLVKIGYAKDPINRFLEIKRSFSTSFNALFSLFGSRAEFVLETCVAATAEAEQFIHSLLRSLLPDKFGFGEWYYPSPIVESVISMLDTLMKRNLYLCICDCKDWLTISSQSSKKRRTKGDL